MSNTAQGGFRPDAYGNWQMGQQRQGLNSLLEYADAYNPVTNAITRQAAAGSLGAGNIHKSDALINYSKQGFMMHQAARAAQGMFGQGSFVDMAYGINMGIQTGGMLVGMGGGYSALSAGGGAAADTMSRMMFDRMNQQMFSKQGFGIHSQTQGRDATDIGRAMQVLANDGAFAGREMFTFGQKSLTARLKDSARDLRGNNRLIEAREVENILSSGKSDAGMLDAIKSSTKSLNAQGYDGFGKAMQGVLDTDKGFTANEKAIRDGGEKVTDFFKLMGTLQDVYGEISEAESVAMTRQLTGKGMGANIKNLKGQIEGMKVSASAMGLGHQQYLAQVANSNATFSQSGFGALGFRFGENAALNGSIAAQQTMAYAGQMAEKGFYIPQVTAEQAAAREAGESAAIINTPGMRRAAEARYRLIYDKSLSDSDRSGISGALGQMRNAKSPLEQASAEAALLQATSGMGPINMSNEALLSSLSENTTQANGFRDDVQAAVRNRVKGNNFTAQARNVSMNDKFKNFASAGGGDLMNVLTSTFGNQTRDRLVEALRTGDTDTANKILSENGGLLAQEGSSKEAVLNSFAKLSSAVGGAGNAGAAIGMGITEMQQRGQISNLVSREDLRAQKQSEANEIFSKMRAGGTDTRTSQKNLFSSVMNNLLSGGGANVTTAQVFDYVNAIGGNLENMAGDINAGSLRLSEEQIGHFSKNKGFMEALGLKEGDKKGLTALSASDSNIKQIQLALTSGGYEYFGDKDGKGINVMEKGKFKAHEENLIKDKTAKVYNALTGGKLSDKELGLLSGNDPTAQGYAAAREKLGSVSADKYGSDVKALQRLAKKGLIDGDDASRVGAHAILQGKIGGLKEEDRNEFFRGFAKDNKKWLEKQIGRNIDEDIKDGSIYKEIRDILGGQEIGTTRANSKGATSGPMTVEGDLIIMGRQQ